MSYYCATREGNDTAAILLLKLVFYNSEVLYKIAGDGFLSSRNLKRVREKTKQYVLNFLTSYLKLIKSHFRIATVANSSRLTHSTKNGDANKNIKEWSADTLSV